MNNDSDRDERYLVEESDDIVLITPIQTLSEDVYITNDDIDDDSGIRTEDDLTGTRSMGGAVGTQHRNDD